MKPLCALLTLLLLASLPAFAQVGKESTYERILQTGTLRCGYVVYPPYLEKDLQTGQLKGPGYDVVMAIGNLLGWKIDWIEEVPVGGEVAVLENGRFDSVCAITAPFDPNMISRISFSSPFVFVRNAIYARAEDPRFEGKVSRDDVNKPSIRFAGIEGDASIIYPKLYFPDASFRELPQLSDTAQSFQELQAGKADLVMAEPGVADRAIANNKNTFRRINYTQPLPEYGAALAFSRENLLLKNTVSEAILYLNINGVLDEIMSRHDPENQLLVRIAKPYNAQ